MIDFRSKTPALAAGGFMVIGLLTYGVFSDRGQTQTRLTEMERQVQALQLHNDQTLAQMASEMKTMGEKMGLTGTELQNAQSLAEQLRQEQANTAQRLKRELSAKADGK